MVSLRERLQQLYRRQQLQRRIDLLVEELDPSSWGDANDSSEEAKVETFRTSEEVDANPIGSSDLSVALVEAFGRGHHVDFVRHPRGR